LCRSPQRGERRLLRQPLRGWRLEAVLARRFRGSLRSARSGLQCQIAPTCFAAQARRLAFRVVAFAGYPAWRCFGHHI